MKMILAAAALLCAFSQSAFAQSKNYEMFWSGVNENMNPAGYNYQAFVLDHKLNRIGFCGAQFTTGPVASQGFAYYLFDQTNIPAGANIQTVISPPQPLRQTFLPLCG
jgi:hypothetical protein